MLMVKMIVITARRLRLLLQPRISRRGIHAIVRFAPRLSLVELMAMVAGVARAIRLSVIARDAYLDHLTPYRIVVFAAAGRPTLPARPGRSGWLTTGYRRRRCPAAVPRNSGATRRSHPPSPGEALSSCPRRAPRASIVPSAGSASDKAGYVRSRSERPSPSYKGGMLPWPSR